MLKLTRMTKDVKIVNADYIFESVEKFEQVLRFLYPKISGDWYIALVEPKLHDVRRYLDTHIVPEYVILELLVEPAQLDQLMMERPKLAVQTKTSWEKYCDLIASMDILIEEKAISEIYRRVGTNTDALRETLESLKSKVSTGTITVKHVRLYVQDNTRIYANQVVRAFLKNDRRAWDYFFIFERDLGENIAFYAIRKYLRKLLKQKNEFLMNNDFKDRAVEEIDAFSIIQMLTMFEEAMSSRQLIPILIDFSQRRKNKC